MRLLIPLFTVVIVALVVVAVVYGPTHLKALRERHRVERDRRRLENRRFENRVRAEEEEAWDRRLDKHIDDQLRRKDDM